LGTPKSNLFVRFRSFHAPEFSVIEGPGSTHIIAIQIVHRNLEESHIIPLAQSPGDCSMSVTEPFRTVVESSNGNELCLVNYAWDMASVEDSRIYVTESSIKAPNLDLLGLITYSEDIGRFVLRHGGTLYVHDFEYS